MATHHIALDAIRGETDHVFYDQLFGWAETLSPENMLCSYLDDGVGFIHWNSNGLTILEEGAAKARSLGLLVEEFDGGWSAVLPIYSAFEFRPKDISPAACFIVTTQKTIDEGEEIIRLSTMESTWDDNTLALEEHGWTAQHAIENNRELVTYDFDRARAAAFKETHLS